MDNETLIAVSATLFLICLTLFFCLNLLLKRHKLKILNNLEQIYGPVRKESEWKNS